MSVLSGGGREKAVERQRGCWHGKDCHAEHYGGEFSNERHFCSACFGCYAFKVRETMVYVTPHCDHYRMAGVATDALLQFLLGEPS
jgi:hypothetical protein